MSHAEYRNITNCQCYNQWLHNWHKVNLSIITHKWQISMSHVEYQSLWSRSSHKIYKWPQQLIVITKWSHKLWISVYHSQSMNMMKTYDWDYRSPCGKWLCWTVGWWSTLRNHRVPRRSLMDCDMCLPLRNHRVPRRSLMHQAPGVTYDLWPPTSDLWPLTLDTCTTSDTKMY